MSLRYFVCRAEVPEITTPNATPLKLKSCQEYAGKVIPYSHIYVTSDTYLRKIKKALGEEHVKAISEMKSQQKEAITNDKRFPRVWSDISSSDYTNLVSKFSERKEQNMVIVNGVGTGFGDNYVALGVLQRLRNLFGPKKFRFHLMQTMNERASTIYMREDDVLMHHNCITIKQLFEMDYLVNLTGMLGFEKFNKLPLAQFFSDAFGLQSLLPDVDLQPNLKLDSHKTNAFKQLVSERFDSPRPIVLFHPKASSPVRTMCPKLASKMVRELVDNGFNVISAFPYENPTKDFKNCSDLSEDIDDFLHLNFGLRCINIRRHSCLPFRSRNSTHRPYLSAHS